MNRKLIVAFFAIAFAGSVALHAEEDMEKGKGPCKADVEKFCKDVKQGHGKIIKCLNQHEAELSAACKTKRTEMQEKMKKHEENKQKRDDKKEKREERKEKFEALKNACKDDAKKLCPGVTQGEGRIIKCLKEKADQTSPACKTALSTAK